jgi:hypothetical protein
MMRFSMRRRKSPDLAGRIAPWQRDFDLIRQRESLWLGGLVSRRLRVLPPWGKFMHQAFGPGYVLLSHIYIDRRVLDAPDEVREYLLLHEWGHVVRRHNQVAMLSAVLMPFVFLPQAYVFMHHHSSRDLARSRRSALPARAFRPSLASG